MVAFRVKLILATASLVVAYAEASNFLQRSSSNSDVCIGKADSCGSEGDVSPTPCCDGLQCAQDFIRGGGLFCVVGGGSDTCIGEDYSCGSEGDVAPQPCCDGLVCSQNFEKGGILLCTAQADLRVQNDDPSDTCIGRADSCGSEGDVSPTPCCDGLQCAQDFIRGGGLFCVAGGGSDTCIGEDYSCGNEGDLAPQPCCDGLVCSQNFEKGGSLLCTAQADLTAESDGTCIGKDDSCGDEGHFFPQPCC